jgi:uncharacterized membrane protein YeiH
MKLTVEEGHQMNIQLAAEVLGTIAFAISGAMLAIDRKMDLFGILVMGLVTALGGGFMRDVTLGIVPPSMFTNALYIPVALLTAFYTYLAVRLHHHMIPMVSDDKFQWILNFTDAIGLGLFTVIGVNAAIGAGYGQYHMFVVFLGMLTGVGGGVIRDIFAGLTPAILRKHIYACASLVGAVSYGCLLKCMPQESAMLVSAIIVVVVRMLAYKFKWNLPKAY